MQLFDANKTNAFDETIVAEKLNNNASAVVLSIEQTAIQAKVGASVMSDRKAIFIQPLGNNVKWGFSDSLQPFFLFKNEFLVLPIGDALNIWLISTSGTVSVVIGEAC